MEAAKPTALPQGPCYTVLVADNFHSGDLGRAAGAFHDLADALGLCRSIVEQSRRNLREPAQAPEILLQGYRLFGDDPYIVAGRGLPETGFSGWDHAEACCRGAGRSR